jgi:hypothetical protein
MDPFLEDSEIWPGFHASLATKIKLMLNRSIGPKYYADVEIQSALQGVDIETGVDVQIRPDVSIFEPLDTAPASIADSVGVALAEPAPIIRPAVTEARQYGVRVFVTRTSELVTAIEILSPINKRPHTTGLTQYRFKRDQLLASRVHLVELDLLRGGERPGLEVNDDPIDTDYIVLVNRARMKRPSAIWPVALNKKLPTIPIPLLPPDPDVLLELNAAVHEVYAESGYDWRMDYTRPVPNPPLRPAMLPVVNALLASRANAS